MARKYTEDTMMRHSAKELFFKACLLFLVVEDDVGMAKQIDVAVDNDTFFNNSMEHKFLKKILDCWRTNDAETYGIEWYNLHLT